MQLNKVRRLVLLSALLLAMVSYFIFTPPTVHRTPKAVILPFAPGRDQPRYLRDIGRRFLTLVHRPKTIRLRAQVFSTERWSAVTAGKVLGRAATAEGNGAMLWLLSPEEVLTLEKLPALQRGELLAAPTIVTTEFAPGSMFVGESISIGPISFPVGIELSLTSRAKEHQVQLALDFLWTQAVTNAQKREVSIRTNAAFTAKMEVPEGYRVLIASEAHQNEPPVYVFIWSLRAQ